MRRETRYNPTLGKLLFILPILIIGTVVVYAYVELNSPGTLILQAETASGTQLQVTVTVNGISHTTPSTLSLAKGSYVASFETIQWYYPPAARDVTITPGHTVYAVGYYQPETKFIQVTGSGFNVTTVTALHGVTPITWINPSSSPVAFSGGPFPHLTINAGQSYTYTFPTAGDYEFSIISTNETMTLDVE